jgi:hypothetical protein
MTSAEEIAWAAGLFEGEGYFWRSRAGGRVYLGVGIEMRDLDVVERFVQVLGKHGVQRELRKSGPRHPAGIQIRRRQNPKHSDSYIWAISGVAAETAFALIRPYLGERRSHRGDEILAEAKAIREEAALEQRVCKACGSVFSPHALGRTRIFCSKLCYGRWKIRQPGQRERARERSRRYKERQRAKGAMFGSRPGREIERMDAA